MSTNWGEQFVKIREIRVSKKNIVHRKSKIPSHSPVLTRAEFDIPVGQIEKMFPAFVVLEGEVYLHKRTPLRPLWLTDQMYPRFGGSAVGLAGIAPDT